MEAGPAAGKGWQGLRQPGCQCDHALAWPERLVGYLFQNDSFILQFQGKSSPAARVREVFATRDQCRRKAVNRAFSLTDFNGNLYSLTLMIRKSQMGKWEERG